MTLPNPFDPDPDRPDEPTHLVLRNGLGQLSLWPSFAPAPAGWTAAHGVAPHRACTDYVERVGETPLTRRNCRDAND